MFPKMDTLLFKPNTHTDKKSPFAGSNTGTFKTQSMARLDIERQKELEPIRVDYAIDALHECGIENMVVLNQNCIEFFFKGEKVKLFPYSGWHTGKSIKDGRGIDKLLKQLK